MKVHFYATLRRIAGGKTVELPPEPGATAKEMIDAVIEAYPDMRSELFDKDGNLYPNVHFFINGRNAIHLDDGLATVIRAEDKIDIFPAVGGGQPHVVAARHSQVIRAVPLWLLESYLVDAGGASTGEGRVDGDGWSAQLTQIDDFVIGSLRIGEVRLDIDGEPTAVRRLVETLEPRLIRAGG